jgi:UrcA family protein
MKRFRRTVMTRLAATSALVAAALLSASAASAAPLPGSFAPVGSEDYRVAYGDLDLATSLGVARFDRRVDRAARSACASSWRWGEIECRHAFRDEAVRALPGNHRQDYARARDRSLSAGSEVAAR